MLSKNKKYIADLESIFSAIPNVEKLANKSIMITGACGLICSSIVDFLLHLNDTKNYNIQVYAAIRPADHVEIRFPYYVTRNDFHNVEYDATLPLSCDIHVDYIIHGASNANPAAYMKEPVETMLANFLGLNYLLDYSVKHQVKRVLYISSSEVYGNKTTLDAYVEDDYNFVDILNVRSCYPSSKRASETLAASYAHEYGVETVMVRPGHVYGPTMSPFDTRAASQFAKDVIDGHDIVMKSEGKQLRSHCYVLDCASAILTVLLNGKTGDAYNISNPSSVSTIRQIAEAYAKAGNQKIIFEVPTTSEKVGFNPMDNSSLSSTKLESLGWKGLFDLETGTSHTVEILKTNKGE